MKPKFLLFTAACVFTAANSGAYASPSNCMDLTSAPLEILTLEETVRIGLCRNPQTAAAYLSAESARLSKNAGYAPYLPSVDASVSGSKQYRNKEWSDHTAGASLSASWLIFDFGKRLADLNQLAAVWRATGFDYSNAVQNYVYEVVAAYYGMLSTDAEVRAATELVAVANGAKDTASKKFAAGAVAKADVLKAETTLAARELELQRANGNREIAKGRLLYLLSFPQENELKIMDMPASFGGADENKTVRELIDKAKKQRPDLLSAEESKNAAWHRRNSAFLRNLPSISATGSLSYDIADTYSAYGAGPNDKLGASIGLRASVPIFAGFANAYSVRAQQANYERAEEQRRSKEDSVEMDIWTAYQNYQTAQKVLEQTTSLLKSATESERVTAGMYKVGRSTMLDWQTQQAELASAKRQDIAAKYDLYIKRAAMAQALGELGEEFERGE
ncbi:MAG: TolC family protein [Rickettsiales bacterium]|jgi:outer membrane protein TolC|nr:TolC family protein [Rickettsiales bacterium]